MNNIELESRIKEIINIENYFDMIIAMKNFEKDYKNSDFYKETKKSLNEVIRESRVHYMLQLNDISQKIQKVINDLDITKLNELLDQIGITFGQENNDIKDIINNFKDIIQ